MAQEYFIATRAHEAIWPGGVMLFYAANECGYATTLDCAGRYSEAVAIAICRRSQGQEIMIPCEVAEGDAARIVDLAKFTEYAERFALSEVSAEPEPAAATAVAC